MQEGPEESPKRVAAISSARILLRAGWKNTYTRRGGPTMMSPIPFLDLRAPYDELGSELDAAYHRVLRSGWYIFGEEVEAFEREFAAACDARHCVSVGNGLDALVLILRAYGVAAGDEVIVPANTYIATWLAISQVGATPVPVEPRGDTMNLDSSRSRAAITPRTKAIMAVHLYGQPAEMTRAPRLSSTH